MCKVDVPYCVLKFNENKTSPTSIQVVHAEQHLMYDLNDILNGIGGSLGLFLGMSLLGLADAAVEEWRKRRGRVSGKGWTETV